MEQLLIERRPKLTARHRRCHSCTSMVVWRSISHIQIDGTSIPIHGFRTIFFNMLPDKNEAVGITFKVCDVQEPVLSFSQILKRGYGCSLTSAQMELHLGKDFKIPIHQEGHHFYIYPVALSHDMGKCHSGSVLSYQGQPFNMLAPSYSMKRTSGGNTDY